MQTTPVVNQFNNVCHICAGFPGIWLLSLSSALKMSSKTIQLLWIFFLLFFFKKKMLLKPNTSATAKHNSHIPVLKHRKFFPQNLPTSCESAGDPSGQLVGSAYLQFQHHQSRKITNELLKKKSQALRSSIPILQNFSPSAEVSAPKLECSITLH